MKHISTQILALSAVLATACGGTIDIGNSDDPSGTGATTSEDGPQSGGTKSQDTGGSSGATIDVSELRKGGYGGGFNVVGPDGQEQDGHALTEQCRESGSEPYSTWSVTSDECRGGSLCAEPCSQSEQCPSLEGESQPLCQKDRGSSQGHCVNVCESNADCPGGMICEQPALTEFSGRICLLEDTAWAPACDGFCMDQDAHEYFGVDCQTNDDCCAGLVCGSGGNCESPAGSTEPDDLRTGGYGGGLNVFGPDGEEVDGHQLNQECLNDGGYAFIAWDEEECRASSVCALRTCTQDSDCPSMANASSHRCLETPSGTKVCVNSCVSEGDCGGRPLACAADRHTGEKMCMRAATPWAEACQSAWEESTSD